MSRLDIRIIIIIINKVREMCMLGKVLVIFLHEKFSGRQMHRESAYR